MCRWTSKLELLGLANWNFHPFLVTGIETEKVAAKIGFQSYSGPARGGFAS